MKPHLKSSTPCVQVQFMLYDCIIIAGVAVAVGSAVAALYALAMMIALTVTVGILVIKSRGKKGECHFGIIFTIVSVTIQFHIPKCSTH